MIERFGARAALYAGAALVGCWAGPAMAQDDAAPADVEESDDTGSDTIVVTGIRSSLASAAAQKRNSGQIIDAVTAEDIGKFPTENVADAVQRITGVQITRTRGSGTAASIRGLPPAFTRVQLNGSTLSSSTVDLRGGGAGDTIDRSFDFRLLPTEFVNTLEVTKSPTADLQEGGLSGTINVKTVRPLDLGETTLVGSAFAVRNSNSGEVTPRASGLASTTLIDGRLGLLFAAGYNRDKTETHNVNNLGWTTQAELTNNVDYNLDGDTADRFNIPAQVRTEIAREDRERLALAGIAEFEATDSLKIFAEGFYSRFDIVVDSLENLNIFTGATGGVYDPATTVFTDIPGIDPAQLASGVPFATTLGLTGVDVRGNDRVNDSLSRTFYGKGGAEFDDEDWSGDLTLSYSKSKQTGDNLALAQIQRFQATYDCSAGEEICGLSFSPASQDRYLDPAQGIVASLNGAFDRLITDEVWEAEGGLTRKFDDSVITGISVGGVASWRDTFANATVLVVPAGVLAPLAGLQASTVQPVGFSIQPYSQVAEASSGGFLGAYNGRQAFPSQWIGTDTLALLDAVPQDQLAASGILLPNLNSVIDVNEDILAGYIRADFESGDGMLSGNVGLRVVNTKSSSVGVSPDLTGVVVNVDTGGTVTVPPAGDVSASNSYTKFLPSANLRLEVSPDFILRFAASRTMSRPTLTQISPSTTLAGGAGNYTITTGNPGLDPFVSLNFDFTAEWYPDRDTALTLALFSKDLSTLVRNETDTIVLPVTFYTASTNTSVVRDQVFQRTRPTNQEGVTLKGFEIGAQKVFTFLPGPLSNTGMQANYTFISNSDPQVLTAASKHNFNLSAFYEDEVFGLRASYTWRDKFVSIGLPDGYNGLGVTTRPRGNLDVNVTFNVTDQFTVIFEGSNVLSNVDATRTTLGNLPVD